MYRTEKDRAKAWKAFHLKNPEVYRLLLRSARRIRARKIEHWGIKNLWEKLRYDLALEVDTNDPNQSDYKLNNDYTAYYSRLMIRDYPSEFKGWFELRGNAQLPKGI